MSPDEVVAFWMGEGTRPRQEWFKKDDAFDADVRDRFGETIARASRGELDAWGATPRGALALVLLLDQFSRNVFRGTARAFSQDDRARALATRVIDAGEDSALSPLERAFLYMPLMHAEDRAMQARAVALFERLASGSPPELAAYMSDSLKYAHMHRDIVDRFGRFPHRNAILGRASTPEEVEFLRKPGSGF